MNHLTSVMTFFYGTAIMCILLDFHFRDLSAKRQYSAVLSMFVLISVNIFVIIRLGHSSYGILYPVLVHLPLYIWFCLFSRYRGIKLFFVLLSAIVLTFPPVMCVTALRTFFRISCSVSFVTFLISYILMLLFIYKFLKPDFNYILKNGENRQLLPFCFIPMLGHIYTFATTKYNFLHPREQSNYLIRQIPAVIVLASYILLVRVFRMTRENQMLENEKSLIRLQMDGTQTHLEQLKNSQQQTVIYRHNMRHHLSILSAFASEGNITKIREYLSECQADIDAFTPMRYCENEIVNLILSAFASKAKKCGVDLYTEIKLPVTLPIGDTDLCSLFSNSVENAVTAAAKLTEPSLRKVFIRALIKDNYLVLSIKNSYAGTIQMDGELPKSENKEIGHGLGIKSMVSIVEEHGGLYSIETEENVFVLRLLLPLTANAC